MLHIVARIGSLLKLNANGVTALAKFVKKSVSTVEVLVTRIVFEGIAVSVSLTGLVLIFLGVA